MRGFLSGLVLACGMVTTQGDLIGIDFGAEYMKVALVAQGKAIEIVTNVVTARKTEVAMAILEDGERNFGSAATGLMTRKPHLVFPWTRELLGRSMEHPGVKKLKNFYFPRELVTLDGRSNLGVKQEDTVLKAEELVGMILQHVVEMSVDFGAAPGMGAVITVPSFWTQTEREALLDAAKIAGLNVVSLLDDNTAAALQFASSRVIENKTNVLYYNMGSTGLQVSIVQHSGSKDKSGKVNRAMSVLAKSWDSTVGGKHFDSKIIEMLADEVNKKRPGKDDIRGFARSMFSMDKIANKGKLMLSANDKAPMFLDSLPPDDTSASIHLPREDYETMCEDMLARVVQPVHDALEMAKMTVADINSVEIIGGGVRVPKVQELVKAAVGKDLGVHLNGDEAMALGAAFYAAKLSPVFKVRQVDMVDVTPFNFNLVLDDGSGSWKKDVALFKRGGKLNNKKNIVLSHTKDMTCTMKYVGATDGMQELAATYKVIGLEDYAAKNEGTVKVELAFMLSTGGLVSLAEASAFVATGKGKTMKRDNVAQLEVTRIYDGMAIKPMTEVEVNASAAILASFDEAASLRKEKETAFNNLGAYLYNSKDKLAGGDTDEDEESPISQVATEDQVAEANKMLGEASTWLEENADTTAVAYTAQLGEIQGKVGPLLQKLVEWNDLTRAHEKMRSYTRKAERAVKKLDSENPKKAKVCQRV